MPPKGKQAAAANGTASKDKDAKSKAAPPSAPKAAPATTEAGSTHVSKPDQAAYHAEQDALKKQIDELQAKLNAVKDKISSAKSGSGNERRDVLRAELDAIRSQQSTNKASRGKILDQIKNLQDGIQAKIKTLQANKGKIPYKSAADVDAQISKLNKSVEAGTMKLVDERKALQEISSLRRVRKTVESFQAEQDQIEADRAKIEELRKQLDDPEVKAVSEKFDTIKNELDGLKKESDTLYEGRSKLFDERTQLTNELEELWKRRKDAQVKNREATNAYWKQANEERARRAERFKAQKMAEEEEKKRAIAEQLLEQAREPAYGAEIQDCQTLIEFFSNKSGTAKTNVAADPLARASVPGAPKLDIRQVEADVNLVVRKKKTEAEENYLVAKKPIKKGNNKNAAPAPVASESSASPSNEKLNIPFGTLSALLAMSIPPPGSVSEVPRVIEDLQTKKAWFQANQARVTKENIAKAEKEIARLQAKAAAKAPAEEPAAEAEATEPASAEPVEASA